MATRRIAVPAGGELAYAADDWSHSFVVVEQGAIELESAHGARRTFVVGDMLSLQHLRLRVLRNRGRIATLLLASTRRGD